MRARALAAASAVAAFFLAGVSPAVGSVAGEAPVLADGAAAVPGELLVRYDPGTTGAERATARRRLGFTKLWDVPLAGVELVLTNDHEASPAAQAARARRDQAVRTAEPNYIWQPDARPDDPQFGELWALDNTGQNGGLADADIDAPEAWGVAPATSDLVVAVIDTGIRVDHPDLRANAWSNDGEIPDNCLDDDGNGYADDRAGWDFYGSDSSVFDSPADDAHGTHVAGTIAAASGNGVAVTGVSQAKIMPIKFIGADGGDTPSAIEAIDYAIANGADIINASWGGGSHSTLLRDKIAEADAAGILFVAAAGNDGADNDAVPHYPAAYAATLSNVVAVAATTNSDALAPFSNYGSRSVALGAPGQGIVSTVPGTAGDAATAAFSGTSMAAPHVAGAAAVVKAAYPNLTHIEVKERLIERGDVLAALSGKTVAGRRLNLAKAIDGPGSPVVTDGRGAAEGARVEVEWTQAEPATATVGTPLRRDAIGNLPAGSHVWVWDDAPVGVHVVDIALVDAGGNATMSSVELMVGTPPAPAPTPAPAPARAPVARPKPTPAPTPAPTPSRSGYWMLGAAGAVYGFGDAGHYGNASLPARTADLEPTPSGNGYWIVDEAGHVAARGAARHYGGLNGAVRPGEVVTSMSATPRGTGYWLFTNLGRVAPFGGAAAYGDMAGVPLNGPVLDSVATPSGRGYYMVGSDGGIFAFGDAAFHGSMGGIPLNAAVTSLVPDGDGNGYWLVASDGGIFAFAAPFHGSMGGTRLNQAVTGMVASGRAGYMMVAADGGIFAFGTAPFRGSLGATPPAHPIVAVAVLRG